MKYKNWEKKFLACTSEKEKQVLTVRLQDMLANDLAKEGTCYESIVAKEGIDLWKFLPNLRKRTRNFKRICPPLLWKAGEIKPSKKLRFTNLMLMFWGEHTQDVFFSEIENSQHIILAGTKGLKIPSDLLPFFISKETPTELTKEDKKSISGRYYAVRAKAREAEGIIDFIPSLDRCAGEPKRIHVSYH